MVKIQQLDRGSSFGRSPHYLGILPLEMVAPAISSRMKQAGLQT